MVDIKRPPEDDSVKAVLIFILTLVSLPIALGVVLWKFGYRLGNAMSKDLSKWLIE